MSGRNIDFSRLVISSEIKPDTKLTTHLKSNMVFSSDEKICKKIRIEYKINNNNEKDKIDFKDIFDENTLEESNIIDKDNKDLMFNKREISKKM